MEKTCKKCDISKPPSDYRLGRGSCKSCENKINYQQKKKRRENDPEYNKLYTSYDVMRKKTIEKRVIRY